jgi:hypothetical protein
MASFQRISIFLRFFRFSVFRLAEFVAMSKTKIQDGVEIQNLNFNAKWQIFNAFKKNCVLFVSAFAV